MAKIKGTIDTYNRQKKCLKITFIVDEKDSVGVAAQLDQFIKKPITLEVLTDTVRLAEELTRITADQRAKIFALIKDIASYTGEGKENQREILTGMFCEEMQIEEFSLSDCSQDTAGNFIEWLIAFAFENGVALSENPVTGLNDIESYIHTCIKHRKCCACGKDAGLVKWDAIPGAETHIPLCDTHKMRAGKIGKNAFKEEFHVFGVKTLEHF